MSELEFSQVQTANLSMLIMVAEHVKQDRTIACSRFGLDPAQAEFITSLTFSNIVALVMHLGDECLFPPRADLIQVLTWPSQISNTLLLVHPHQPDRHLGAGGSTTVESTGQPKGATS